MAAGLQWTGMNLYVHPDGRIFPLSWRYWGWTPERWTVEDIL